MIPLVKKESQQRYWYVYWGRNCHELCVVALVILYFFFEVPLYSVILNLLVIPLMPVILSCGMAGSLVRMAGGTFGTWILMVCSRILKFYDGCCVLLLKFPVARWIAGRPEKWRSLVYYLMLSGVILNMEIYGQTAGKNQKKVHG